MKRKNLLVSFCVLMAGTSQVFADMYRGDRPGAVDPLAEEQKLQSFEMRAHDQLMHFREEIHVLEQKKENLNHERESLLNRIAEEKSLQREQFERETSILSENVQSIFSLSPNVSIHVNINTIHRSEDVLKQIVISVWPSDQRSARVTSLEKTLEGLSAEIEMISRKEKQKKKEFAQELQRSMTQSLISTDSDDDK